MSDHIEVVVQVSVKADLIYLAMTREELHNMSHDTRDAMFAENLVNLPSDSMRKAVADNGIHRFEVIEERDIEIKHQCDNCGEKLSDYRIGNRLWPHIPDLGERLDPGGVVPSGECPQCQGLCYPIKEDDS